MPLLSIEFVIFFLLFFPLYWSCSVRWQNRLLLLCSLVLLAYLDKRFLFMLLGFSVFMHGVALFINRNPAYAKIGLIIGIVGAIVQLAWFKYFHFFAFLFPEMGNIFMPLGLSYYTFQGIHYLVEVYRHPQIKLSYEHLILYFGFFPTITAGPISRVSDFHHQGEIYLGMGEQIKALYGREILYPALALSLIVLGIAKKWWWAGAIGDHFVNPVFDNPLQFDSMSILLAIYGYTAQLFFDFSGYSDLVIGIALLLGFQLPYNFNMPFYAHNIREFWHRWHMSLSSWIRDYIFIPLGGSRKGFKNTQYALFIAMVLSGIWHGSGLNFLVWGALHGVFLILLNITDSIWGRDKISASAVGKVLSIIFTFNFVCFSFLIFRADSFSEGMVILKALFYPVNTRWSDISLSLILLTFTLLALYQWIAYAFAAWVEWLENRPFYFWLIPLTLFLWIIIVFAPSGIPNFIYANF